MQNSLNNNFIILATPSPVSHRTAEENLGLGYLAAILRKNGYNVKIIDGWLQGLNPKQLANTILSENRPLFIGFSTYQSNIDQAIKTIEIIKRTADIPCIAGGFGPTFSPDLFLDNGFQVAVRGEAEESIVDLAQYFQGKKSLDEINGVSYKKSRHTVHTPIKPLKIDVNDIPSPVRDTIQYALDRRTPVHLLTARGCTGHCSFCSIASFFKLSNTCKWRGCEIPKIIGELKTLQNLGVQHIKVIDDSFVDGTRDENWCKEFSQQIKDNGIKINLRGSIRADKVSDKTIGYLKDAGFFSFSCGVENFSEAALKRMGKVASAKQNIYALDVFKSHGIYVQAGQILFDPYTTMSELWENYYHMRHYDWIISKGVFTEMFAATGTSFQNKISKKNLVVSENPKLGNHVYQIQEEKVRAVYDALKLWHMTNMKLYDKAIDPLTSPKALDTDEMKLFYDEYLKIHRKDLEVMRTILDITEYGDINARLQDTVKDMIENSKMLFSRVEQNIDAAYKQCRIVYDAQLNPFIQRR